MKPHLPGPQNSREYHLGLIGYPLGHSLSPTIHQAALQALGLGGEYRLYPIEPSSQGLRELSALFDQLRAGRIQGLNVTIPHKRTVLSFLDELSPAASAIGAVNTLYLRDRRLVGANTDAPGFWADLERQFAGRSLQAARAVVLGAGGSARAVVYALLEQGCQVTVMARRVAQAQELAAQFASYAHQLAAANLADFGRLASGWDLIVNTTPLGMSPHPAGSPWPNEVPFPSGAVVYDLVYNPRPTLLVQCAQEAGLAAATGLGMLVEQAAIAFELWTGQGAPRREMLESVCI
jgi:shikimate dehydrogenase